MTTPETPRVDSRGAQEGDATNATSNDGRQGPVIGSPGGGEIGQSTQINTADLPFADQLAVAAWGYAARGWRVLPVHWVVEDSNGRRCSCRETPWMPSCPNTGKHPVGDNWNGLATNDRNRIGALWCAEHVGANIGIATGQASGIWVLDVDEGVRKDGTLKEGRAALARLQARYEALPETFTVRTGGGGDQRYFLLPPGLEIKSVAGKFGEEFPDIDVRGEGGQVVAPPSVSGKGAYVVADPRPLVYAPDWLIRFLEEKGLAKWKTNGHDTATHQVPSAIEPAGTQIPAMPTPSWVAGSITAKIHAVRTAPDGQGNDTINDMAFQIGQYIPRGWVEFEDAKQRLEEAVESWTHPHPNYRYTIDRSLRQGVAKPYVSRTGNDDVPEEEYFERLVWKREMFLRADEEARRRRALENTVPVESVSAALDAILSGDRGDVPTVGLVTDGDGAALFYAGLVNGVFGDASAGKSLLIADVQTGILNSGGIVVHWEFDNNSQRLLVRRLLNAGAQAEAIRSRFVILRSLADRDHLAPDVATNTRLVTLDALSPAIASLGMKVNDSEGVDSAFAAYFGPFTVHGACGLYIDHIGHENTDRQRGSKRKFDATQGALYEMQKRAQFRRGARGLSVLQLRKDNPAGAGEVDGTSWFVEYESHGDGLVRTTVRGLPSDLSLARGPGADEAVKRAVLDHMRGSDGPFSKSSLEKNVPGRGEVVREAVAELLREGAIRRDPEIAQNRPNLFLNDEPEEDETCPE